MAYEVINNTFEQINIVTKDIYSTGKALSDEMLVGVQDEIMKAGTILVFDVETDFDQFSWRRAVATDLPVLATVNDNSAILGILKEDTVFTSVNLEPSGILIQGEVIAEHVDFTGLDSGATVYHLYRNGIYLI